jgi:ubiquinone/menaquinone biosynthesis C-methylase UbiE
MADVEACCAPEAQQTCCEPEVKHACCGKDGSSCACSAGKAEDVRKRYAAAAVAVQEGRVACCVTSEALGGSCGCGTDIPDACDGEQFGAGLYEIAERADLPDAAQLASLGCGNPTAVADLHEGETVLDLGSGGGIDVLLSARRVGPTGRAYGLDMTDEMLELARRNQDEAGIVNADFIKGTIEKVPLPASSIDVVISNCVINLSGDKPTVFREAIRVLKPGGRFAVTDVIADAGMDEETRSDVKQWTGCIAGAMTEGEFRRELVAAGFTEIEIQETHRVHDQAGSAIIRAKVPA